MKIASSCWRLSCGVLVGLMFLAPRVTGAGLNPADPQMGFQLDARSSAAISPAKLEKLQENLRHGAEDYRAGRFDRAINWYESALVLDPERADLRQAVEAARKMRQAQDQALKRLPADAKERQRYFEMAYQSAVQSLDQKKTEQSYNALYQLWLTAGDFNGKTVKMLDRIRTSQPDETVASYQVASVASDQPDRAPAFPSAGMEGDEAQAGIEPSEISADEKTRTDLRNARAAIQTGYSDDARRILNDVLQREPANAAAQRDLAILDRKQAGEAAMKQSKAFIDLAAITDELGNDVPVRVAQADTAPAPVVSPAGDAAQVVAAEVDDVTRLRVNRLIHDAEVDIAAGRLEPARTKVREALAAWPSNERARRLQQQLTEQQTRTSPVTVTRTVETTTETVETTSTGPSLTGAPVMVQTSVSKSIKRDPATIRQLDEMHRQANRAYEAGDVQRARGLWREILTIDPENVLAQQWLENTEDEVRTIEANTRTQAEAARRRAEARELLNSPITISTDHEISLTEFMNLLSFTTPRELQYYVAEGARAQIYASFQDQPLRVVLDTVLNERGLTWTLDPETNVITISQKLITRTFRVSPDQMNQLRTLSDTRQLQRLIWGQTDPPAQGVDITLDERQNLLIVTGSQLHIQGVESLLPSIEHAVAVDIVTRFYKIRPADGPRIRALVNSIIQSRPDTAFEAERKIIIDDEDLIIRDTPENIKVIEDLLLDQNFIDRITERKLDIQSFSLVPKDVESVTSDEILAFTTRVVEAIQVFLYAQEGRERASEQGRRMWFDEATLQLTIVDTPANIQRVSEYINSLPQIRQSSTQRVIELKNAVAEDLAASIDRILNLTGTAGLAGGAGSGSETSIRLRRGEERQWGNLRIRLIRVEQNDETDRNDDSIELTINTGIEVRNENLRELETRITDEYEITARDVLPSSGQRGDGSATIEIRRFNRATLAQDPLLLQQQQAQAELLARQASQEQGIEITPIGELNVLVIRYTNPALYKEAVDLIAQLDRPTLQVQIETRFVEVNEAKAKEVSAEFGIDGLGKGRDIDWSSQLINTRFANDVDEFRSVFDPAGSPVSSNLMKGTTTIGALIGGYPLIDYSLRLLEAEGVVNVINGPKVAAIDGREAEFRIESYINDSGDDVNTNALVDFFNPIQQGDVEIADVDEATQAEALTAVVLRVTPEITSRDSIILRDLSAEIVDFDRYVNQVLSPTVQDVADQTQDAFYTVVLAPNARSSSSVPIFKRKKIVTDARVTNGGTIVIGGWTGERSEQLSSGIPVLRNMPYIGKLLFNRAQWRRDRTTLLIFLTCNLID